MPLRSLMSTSVALDAFMNPKSSDATALPVFQLLIWTLYCGEWGLSLDVTT